MWGALSRGGMLAERLSACLQHGYMVSLADALFLASVVGSSVALTIFAIVQIQLVLDFRGQVHLQERDHKHCAFARSLL
jgi:hypothetical protein